jgi:tRNA threonylcarbamoyl adenosine modification protein YjeE
MAYKLSVLGYVTAMMTAESYLVPEFQVTTHGEYETGRLAAAIAKVSVAGDLIRLVGPLGAGKSTFARYFLQELGHAGEVPSPTYTLVQTYAETRFPVAHVDAYRMETPDEMAGLGLDATRKYGIILCEWPEKGNAMVADEQPDFLDYHINSIENPGTLTLEFVPSAHSEFGRTITLRGSLSWQRRFALLPKLGVEIPYPASRPVGDEGRKAFLEHMGVKNYTLENVAGDWSGRSYARVTLADGSTQILMDAPPPQEGVTTYAQVAHAYREMGLRATKVLAGDDAQGYLLVEDFGHHTLWDKVKDGEPEVEWYMAAAEGLITQCKALPPAWARRYSPKDWWVEVVRFTNWYLPFARKKATTLDETAAWQAMWAPLYNRVMKMPLGLMMWDCQSPNLMILGDEPKLENLGWIDIQDARVAPVAQDLALLLRNIRSPQDDAREAVILDRIADRLALDRAELQTCVDICSLHHSCRILGGLARLYVRDGKPGPAQAYMDRTWMVARQSFACPELAGIVEMMKHTEVPGLVRLWQETQAKKAG